MNRFSASLLAALVATTLVSMPTPAGGANRPMTLDEVVIGAMPLVPSTSSSVEAFFRAPPGAQRGTVGWVHQPIVYRTRDGVLLHVQLTSDWENGKAPDVVRLVAEVDGKQCLDAKKLRDKLERGQDIAWTSQGINQGWSAKWENRFVTIGQRDGRCLASVNVDVRQQPRLAPPLRPYKMDRSGIPRPVLPGH
ncbi:hypothetical protein [Luteibacter sp. dw_328]|uniref:hypothetical protein n=1 Tax=Luteibacter sp. dw_328 TaxID=2719796 RepID=UPI001BD69CBE|nr:hypothetical protein [Luteibacter sp. dw_328]